MASNDTPKSPENPEPFIPSDQRPDLTIDMSQKVGELTVRDLSTILGNAGTNLPKLKEIGKEIHKESIKEPLKEVVKEFKDRKDHKETKDHKDPKEQKDTKDSKDHKEQVDQKAHKEAKDHKDPKEHKDLKDHNDTKGQKDHKDHKDHKEIAKDHKEIAKDHKELVKEVLLEHVPILVNNDPPPPGDPQLMNVLEGLIQRLTGLESRFAQASTANEEKTKK